MSEENFYHRLKSFQSFDSITDDNYFEKLPDDWFVIITDIKGSTVAIEAGRYRDVNTLGVATIIATQNAMQEDFPYVFGGDGATLLIAPAQLAAVKRALLGVKALAESNFALELRIGVVPVQELTAQRASIEVAKFSLVPNKAIAILRGGGIAVAEEKVKKQEATYCLKKDENSESNLVGLSCRWQPIPAKQERILTMLVLAKGENKNACYKEVLGELNKIVGVDQVQANPVHLETMSYKSFTQALKDELRYHDKLLSKAVLLRIYSILVSVLIFKFKVLDRFFDRNRYNTSLATHSDYRKFDDMLRMILDCSEPQAQKIEALLAKLHTEGKICYGIHSSATALMTCFVQNTGDGGHIHFIDGGDGGYAMAAKQLKMQLKGS